MKKYRTEWTIDSDIAGPGVHWFRGDYDGDPMKICKTVEEAEREIDDAIILEQVNQIDMLKTALENSQATLKGVRSALAQFISFETLDGQIKQNEQALKYCES